MKGQELCAAGQAGEEIRIHMAGRSKLKIMHVNNRVTWRAGHFYKETAAPGTTIAPLGEDRKDILGRADFEEKNH